MLQPILDQLNKIESMDYEGHNAEALRAMDFQELRRLAYEAEDKDQRKDYHVDNMKDHMNKMSNIMEEYQQLLYEMKIDVGNL